MQFSTVFSGILQISAQEVMTIFSSIACAVMKETTSQPTREAVKVSNTLQPPSFPVSKSP